MHEVQDCAVGGYPDVTDDDRNGRCPDARSSVSPFELTALSQFDGPTIADPVVVQAAWRAGQTLA